MLDQAEQHFNHAHQLNQAALDGAMQMCSGSWTGNASANFLQCVQGIHDDNHPHIQGGLHQVDTHRTNLHTQNNHDNL